MAGGCSVSRGWLLGALVLVLAVAGLSRLRLDSDPLSLLPSDLPSVSALRLQQELFPSSKELLITVKARSADAATSLASQIADDLGRRTNLVASTRWDTGFQESLPEFAAWTWAQAPTERLLQLEKRLAPDRLDPEIAGRLERLATSLDPVEIARLGYDPLGLIEFPGVEGLGMPEAPAANPFSSVDGTFRVVMVAPVRPGMQYKEASVWLDRIRELVTATHAQVVRSRNDEAFEIAFTGHPAFMTEIANGMESDMTSSVLLTLAIICLLFWSTHRSLKPLGWLVASLVLTFLITLTLGGLVLGGLNVISCGFAAVMMGLVVDYGLVGYQELRAHPGQGLREIRRAVMPGILWSATTTAGTFLSLRFAGLPGLSELGTLTALGLGVGACVTLFWFLPRVVPVTTSRDPAIADRFAAATPSPDRPWFSPRSALVATAVLVAAGALGLGIRGWPKMERASDPLLPRNSVSQAAMNTLQRELGRTNKTSWLLATGADATAVRAAFEATLPRLEAERDAGRIRSFQLPTAVWPAPEHARTNLAALARLAARQPDLESRLLAAGFSTNSLVLTRATLDRWRQWSGRPEGVPTWPESPFGEWIAHMVSARGRDGSWTGLGTLESTDGAVALPDLPPGVQLTGWDRLGPELLNRVVGKVRLLTAAILLALVVCLWFAFRRWTEVLLGLSALALSFGLLFAVMSLTGATWNLLNLVAIPLILGTSVDSTIHIQLALRRHRGNLRAVWRSTGIALLLCAGANIAGFGSLAWSNNAGLASLDIVCAGGVVCVLAVVLLLLPGWWLAVHRPNLSGGPEPDTVRTPSQLYGTTAWTVAAWISRQVPRDGLTWIARQSMRLYLQCRPERLRIVMENLRPVVGDDPRVLRSAAIRNGLRFAEKLVDLWRFEAGLRPTVQLREPDSWVPFREAVATRQGVLLVTVHLGNWELGAPLLTDLGIRPMVLSAAEPQAGLTAQRARARAHYGVDTVVVGTDPFAFVDVIRRLQDGGVVALLLDRPPPASGVPVSFLGRRFLASPAAAELARATGARIFPLYIVRDSTGDCAHVLPELTYRRTDLATRDQRRTFTQELMARFEPVVRQHPDQWFHFVPIWNSQGPDAELPSA